MRVLSLFSGIGGFDLAAEWAGCEVVGQVEIDPFCNRVLAKHWPDVKRMEDIKDVKGTEFGTVDLICGGFPCQPFSCAGKRKGKDDSRHLWPEMCRVIREAQPEWVLAENVSGLLSQDGGLVFEHVLTDLEDAGYETLPLVIPACGVGAPHRRDRVWIVAHSISDTKGSAHRGEIGECIRGRKESDIGKWDEMGSDIADSDSFISNPFKRPTEIFNTGTMGCPNAEKNIGRQAEIQNAVTYRDCDASNTDRNRAKRHEPEYRKGRGIAEDDSDAANPGRGRLSNCRPQGREGESGQRGRSTDYAEKANRLAGWGENWLEAATRLCRVDDGLPRQVDRVNRLKALGNSIVPQIAYELIRAMKESV